MPRPTVPAPHATGRTPGFDVARALAVLGMVLVNYRARMQADAGGPEPVGWVIDRMEGRSAALFVVLAGLGVSLRSRRARQEPARYLRFERQALLKRALVVALVGLVHLLYWEWDILHFYGLFLFMATLVLSATDAVLLLLAFGFAAVAVFLQTRFDYGAPGELGLPHSALRDLLFNGLHPAFPWMAFLLLGMWLGRRDLRDTRQRRVLLGGSLALAALGESLDTIALRAPELLGPGGEMVYWLSSDPRPPQPVYVLAAGASAVAVICFCVSVTARRALDPWVVRLTATGQMAFTLYLAHTVAIAIPQQYGLLEETSLLVSVLYSLAFYAAAVAASVWWRARFPLGPIEAFIRQVTGRTTPAPWGGTRLADLPAASGVPSATPARVRAPTD